MRDNNSDYYVGLDIGTTTVRCVVGTLDNASQDNQLSIIGQGSSPNLGMRKGVVVHIDDVATAISGAIAEAERLAGVRVEQATVNINGSHIVGSNSRGVVAISTANREITIDDRLRVEEAATIVKLPQNREIVQVFAKNYRLDGQDNIKDPVGMQGVRLEVDTHIVTASTPTVRMLSSAMQQAGVGISRQAISSLASAEAVLNRQQKEAGTLVLDIGGGTTNGIVIEDGEVQHAFVLPVGGVHITNDLAIGLKTDLDVAEYIKLHITGLSVSQKKGILTYANKGNKQEFPADQVVDIIEARVDELFEYVDKELKRIGKSRKLPGGVVLVGGSAKLPGIAERAKEVLELAVRVSAPSGISGLVDTVSDPAYATVVGLCTLDLLLAPLPNGSRTNTLGSGATVFGLLQGVLRKVRRK